MDWNLTYIATHAQEIAESILWPEGPVCPVCGSHEYRISKDGRHRCKHCHKFYTISTGTIFQGTHLPLSKWMIALYLLIENKGLSSCALARYISVHQTTAYYMMTKLRFLFTQEDVILKDEVAIDEEYVGGSWSKFSLSKRQELLSKYKLPSKPRTINEKIAIGNRVNSLYKQPVIGMNDGSKLLLYAVPNPVTREDILTIFNKHTLDSGHTVSDCSNLYDNWQSDTGYTISHNNHSKGQFKAEDGSSSNRIEGSFSQWKRQSLDKYCSISKRMLQLYLDEHCWRFNNKDLPVKERMMLAMSKCHQVITRCAIDNYNYLDNYPIRKQEIFDPWEFFKSGILDKITVNSVVYYKEDFVRNY